MRRLAAACLGWLALAANAAVACDDRPWLGEAMDRSLVRRAEGGSAAGPVAAWYAGPTDRYAHGVLGDAIEPAALAVQLGPAAGCAVARLTLPAEMVFEDVAPRLADLDGDGTAEIVTVRSHAATGAQLAVWAVSGPGSAPRLQLVATTPPIGRPNRWLAPAGIADLDADGAVEIAYVDRPHLARILRVWRFVPDGQGGGDLFETAAAPGFTNHRIGAPTIAGGLRRCGESDLPELILATPDWSRILGVTVRGGTITANDLGPWYPARVQLLLEACPAPPP